MEFEFVKTKEFNENMEDIKETLSLLKDPKMVICTVLSLIGVFGFYLVVMILADTISQI